jgi:hypothetical protein
MGLVQKWIGGLLFLGAGYLVLTNPNGFASFASGTKNLVAGSEVSIITGGQH